MKNVKRQAAAAISVVLFAVIATSAVAAAVGPYRIDLSKGSVQAKLTRMEKGTVWIQRKTDTGASYDTGVKVSSIKRVFVPWPKEFDAPEAAKTSKQAQELRQKMAYYVHQHKAFRTLPGVRVDEAIVGQAKLYEARERWKQALKLYKTVLDQKTPSDVTEVARVRAGICSVELGDYEGAVTALNKDAVPPDDPGLLADVCFARGKAFQELERYDEALMEYLYPVVFMPYEGENEVRGLGAAAECYALLKDWRSLGPTVEELKTKYPDAEETAKAKKTVAEHEEELAGEKAFQVDYEKEMEDSEETEGVQNDE